MKKSIKKHLQVGSIIITKDNGMYRVTELHEKYFVCKKIYGFAPNKEGYTQEFYYYIEMEIYNFAASNFK